MASYFAVWEKDPFFSAAEEVQELADRDLLTALSTTKWQVITFSLSIGLSMQLEEFERIVKSSYTNSNSDVAKERHCEFTLSNGHPVPPPRKIPSLGLLSSIEAVFKLNWSKNGYRTLKNADHHQEAGTPLPQSQQLTRAYIPDLSAKGINTCYERSKSCIDGCDDYCDKQLHGWYGAIQRLFQRSQYQMQYSRPLQVVLLLGLIGGLDVEPREPIVISFAVVGCLHPWLMWHGVKTESLSSNLHLYWPCALASLSEKEAPSWGLTLPNSKVF
ncbi:syntaxin/t-SNARE family protein [Actinidia rufa]|uniref:Syntaxin/t-SNARE family protein n=1 Tax=Actinidia rufa TaxID=165716 RepID=A0A7J0FCL4_9ERIC|nr:syntaxin/t-SNARE family protein [Actinidia rufa]